MKPALKEINFSEIAKRVAEHPKPAGAQTRLTRAQTKLQEASVEAERILEQINVARQGTTDDQVGAMLYQIDGAVVAMEPLQESYTRAIQSAELWRRAIKQGERERDFARQEVTGEILRELMPAIREEQRQVVAAYASAALAAKKYRAFVQGLQQAGLHVPLDHVFTGNLSNGTEHNSVFFTWCSSLIDRGLAATDDLPEELRKGWGW